MFASIQALLFCHRSRGGYRSLPALEEAPSRAQTGGPSRRAELESPDRAGAGAGWSVKANARFIRDGQELEPKQTHCRQGQARASFQAHRVLEAENWCTFTWCQRAPSPCSILRGLSLPRLQTSLRLGVFRSMPQRLPTHQGAHASYKFREMLFEALGFLLSTKQQFRSRALHCGSFHCTCGFFPSRKEVKRR